MFHFSRIKCDKSVATTIRYPQPFRIHQWDQECDVIKNTPNKEVKTSTDLHQGQQIKKKKNDIRKALGRDRCFLAPWK